MRDCHRSEQAKSNVCELRIRKLVGRANKRRLQIDVSLTRNCSSFVVPVALPPTLLSTAAVDRRAVCDAARIHLLKAAAVERVAGGVAAGPKGLLAAAVDRRAARETVG